MDSLGRVVFLAALAFVIGAGPAAAATFSVTSTADAVDAVPGDGMCATASDTCTLRAAVQEANGLAGPDTITLPAGTYRLAIAGAGEDSAATGDLDVTDALTAIGAAARSVTVSARTSDDPNADRVDRVFDVIPGGSLTLSKVTIDGGGGNPGGNIRAAGRLVLTDVTVANGLSGSDGGGIWSSAPLSLERVTLRENGAPFSGLRGGGVASSGSLSVVNSTFYDDYAGGDGGGIAVLAGTADVVNATFAFNRAQNSGSQIYNVGSTQVRNSILEHDAPLNDVASVHNCGGNAIASGGHNVDDDGGCGFAAAGDRGFNFFAWTEINPVDVGGETDAMPPFHWPFPDLGAGGIGPAVDIGGEGCPATDQRGVARPQGASCDAGAYEATFADLGIIAGGVPPHFVPGDLISISLTVVNNGPAPARPALSETANTAIYLNRDGFCGGDSCVPPLAPGESATIYLTGTAPAQGPVTVSVTARNGGPVAQAALDPNSVNSTVELSIPVVPSTTPPPALPALKRGACGNSKVGTRAPDRLRGTMSGDLIRGLAGDDRLFGLDGNDCLDGGAGDDLIDGGPGRDRLTGGRGRDRIIGGPGADVIDAADHERDTIDCGGGRDSATVDKIDRVKHCERVKRKRFR